VGVAEPIPRRSATPKPTPLKSLSSKAHDGPGRLPTPFAPRQNALLTPHPMWFFKNKKIKKECGLNLPYRIDFDEEIIYKSLFFENKINNEYKLKHIKIRINKYYRKFFCKL
jgi:hypothetical protein